MPDYIRISCVFVAGIYLAERISPSFAIIFIPTLILVLTITAIFKHEFNIRILFMVLIFFLGLSLSSLAQNTERYKFNNYMGRYVTVTGRICELPIQSDDDNYRYIIDGREFSHKGESYKIKEKLILTTKSDYKYGDTVTFGGFISPIEGKANENGADYSRYYGAKKIFFTMYSENVSLSSYKICNYSPYSFNLYIRTFISKAIDRRYKGDYGAILKAVLSNDKRSFSPEFDAVLERTALKRFYFPAYLHVMIWTAFMSFALGFLKKKYRDTVLIFFLIIYAMFNISGAAFVKISLVAAMILFYKKFHGYVYYLDIIGAVALIMGIVNPLVFYDIGFIFSMLSSVLIYYFYDSADKYFKFIHIKYVRRTVVVSVICTIGMMPISALFFDSVSLASIPVSFIMLPFVAVILILAPLAIPLLAIFGQAPVFGWVMTACAFVLYYVPVAVDKLKFLSFSLLHMNLTSLIIYFFLIVALVKHIKQKKRDMLIALLTAAALSVSLAIVEAERLNDVEFIFVNVGQGDGAIIRSPHKFNVLIDGGGGNAYSDYNPGKAIYLEYLKSENMRLIDSAYVSHYHKDHVQGIIAAIENLKVRNVFMPDTMRGSEWRLALEKSAHENGTKIHYLTEEVYVRYNNGMTIRAIPPGEHTISFGDENDTSWLYYVTYGDFSALYTGDMTERGESDMLKGHNMISADLLKVAHHGSDKSTSKEWADTVNPMYSVISVGKDNIYNMPSKRVLSCLDNSLVYRTDQDGDIRFIVNKKGIKNIKTFRSKQ